MSIFFNPIIRIFNIEKLTQIYIIIKNNFRILLMSDKNQYDKNKDSYNLMIKLFILSMVVFGALYFIHNLYISYRLDKVMQRYTSPLENIIITKEEYYTNIILTEIESNKFITNNIILKNSSIEDLEKSFEKAIDTHTKSLQVSMGEVVKTSSDTLNFWFAFISVVMIVFSFAGAFVNNNILKEAKEQLTQVEKESAKSLEAIKIETQKLIEQNDKNIKINSEFNLGYQAYQSKKYRESIEYFSKVIELDDNNSNAYYNRGVVKNNLQQYEEAIEDFNKAIELDNNNSNAYYNRGLAKYNLQRYEEAIEDYNKAIELGNNDILVYNQIYNQIGFIKTKQANIELKKLNYDKALGLLNEAIEYYDKGIKIKSDNSEIYDSRGYTRTKIANFERDKNNIYNAIKLYKECIEDFNKAIELNNEHALAYNSLVYIKNILTNIQKDKISEEDYNQLKKEALDNFNKAYEFANEDLKEKIIKYLSKLAENNEKIAIDFFKTHNFENPI